MTTLTPAGALPAAITFDTETLEKLLTARRTLEGLQRTREFYIRNHHRRLELLAEQIKQAKAEVHKISGEAEA